MSSLRYLSFSVALLKHPHDEHVYCQIELEVLKVPLVFPVDCCIPLCCCLPLGLIKLLELSLEH